MSRSTNTLERHWHLLRLLPRYPRKVTAGDLQQRLQDDGHRTTKRSVERDLMTLSAIFPIELDDRVKPYGWSWSRNAPILDVPGLTAPQALAFALVERFLDPLLPASIHAELDPYFRAAAQRLGAEPKRRAVPSWTDKIRVVQPSQTLRAPKIDHTVQATVYEALLQDRQVSLVYHRRGADNPAEYTVHVLGLVQRGPVFYLVCTIFDYEDVRLLDLHRVLSARLVDEATRRPKGFDLDAYIAGGAIDFGVGRKIRLEVLFTKDAARHLEETPLSDDQTVRPADGEWVKVVATVNDTPQLAWWLLGFGEQAEVLKPAQLRASLGATARAMARRYGKRAQ